MSQRSASPRLPSFLLPFHFVQDLVNLLDACELRQGAGEILQIGHGPHDDLIPPVAHHEARTLPDPVPTANFQRYGRLAAPCDLHHSFHVESMTFLLHESFLLCWRFPIIDIE